MQIWHVVLKMTNHKNHKFLINHWHLTINQGCLVTILPMFGVIHYGLESWYR